MRTEWRATDDPWWPLWTVLLTGIVGAELLIEVVVFHRAIGPSVALPVVVGVLSVVGSSRGRLRLTDAGVEVRRLRTRVYRWSDIASVERAPEWASASAVWMRLHGSVPTSEPEILSAPGVRGRAARDQAAEDIVAGVRLRAGLAVPPEDAR